MYVVILKSQILAFSTITSAAGASSLQRVALPPALDGRIYNKIWYIYCIKKEGGVLLHAPFTSAPMRGRSRERRKNSQSVDFWSGEPKSCVPCTVIFMSHYIHTMTYEGCQATLAVLILSKSEMQISPASQWGLHRVIGADDGPRDRAAAVPKLCLTRRSCVQTLSFLWVSYGHRLSLWLPEFVQLQRL